MNAETTDTIKNIYSYIQNYFLSNQIVFSRNLKVMKFNTDLEWFNCASIAVNIRNGAYEQVIVNTIEGWESVLESEHELSLIESDIKGIPLLNPCYSEEDDYLTFDILDTYYLMDFKIDFNLKYKRKSAISIVLENYKEYLSMLNLLKDGWQDIFLNNYLKLFEFYYLADEPLKRFYLETLRLVFAEELHIKDDTFHKLENEEYDLITIYRNVHELITSFHVAYKTYLNSLEKVYREIGIELEQIAITHSNVYERIKQLSGQQQELERGDEYDNK